MEICGAVKQVYADNSNRFLLAQPVGVMGADVNDDLRWLCTRSGLKSDPEPSIALSGPAISPRRHGIGENKEVGLAPSLEIEPGQQGSIFEADHGFEPRPS